MQRTPPPFSGSPSSADSPSPVPPSAAGRPPQGLRARFQAMKEHRLAPVFFFVAGFVVDAITLSRPDTFFQIAQQAVYLTTLTLMLAASALGDHGLIEVPKKFQRFWKYNEFITHFLLGSLLNIYTLFFFKSGTLLGSIAFMLLIAGLLIANEFVRLKRNQIILKLVLYFLCVTCFWLYIIPMVMGFIGKLAFILSIVISNGFIWCLYGYVGHRLEKKALPPEVRKPVLRKIFFSGYGVLIVFVAFYALALIPPVPLSLQYSGIFREVRKEGDEFVLSYARPAWKFWQHGDQDFQARSGDKVIAFFRVFAPRGFRDQLLVRWSLRTPRGWEKQDAIPISVSGGRDGGFRGYTVKQNYQAGEYRVQIETTDGREIGRIGLEISRDESTDERTLRESRH